MTTRHPADEALRRTLRVAVPVEDPARVEQRRQQLVGVITREVSETPYRERRRERLLQWGRWAAAAVLALSVGGAAWALNSHGGDGAGPSDATGLQAAAVSAGDVLSSTPEHPESIRFVGGTTMDLAGTGKLTVSQATDRLHEVFLGGGALLVDVPPTESRDREVRVNTPHARVEVTGTRFTVDVVGVDGRQVDGRQVDGRQVDGRQVDGRQVDGRQVDGRHWAGETKPASSEGFTRIRVQRGRVFVRGAGQEKTLTAGQSWTSPSQGDVSASEAPAVLPADESRSATKKKKAAAKNAAGDALDEPGKSGAADALGDPGESAARPERGVVGQRREKAANSSTLAKHNALLVAAVRAERAGDLDRALSLVDRLLKKYPDSPLRSTALAERRRLLRLQRQ